MVKIHPLFTICIFPMIMQIACYFVILTTIGAVGVPAIAFASLLNIALSSIISFAFDKTHPDIVPSTVLEVSLIPVLAILIAIADSLQ